MKRRVLLFVLLLFLQPLAQESIPEFRPVAEGLEFRQVTLMRPRPLTLLQLRCDPSRVRFNLLTARDLGEERKTATAREMAEAFGQEAVINSSYFGHDHEILGYAERLGHVLNSKVATGGVFSAFFYHDGARAGFKRRGEPLPKDVPVLFQAGPRLVWDGLPVEGLDDSAHANRTALAEDAHKRIVIVVVGGLFTTTLEELPGLLLRPVEQGGVGAVRALNLDGGSSTQFYLNTEKTAHHLPGRVPVPVFLGVEVR